MTEWPVLEIELLWIVSLFDQDHGITNFNRMTASGNQRCIALPLPCPYRHFHTAVSWSFLYNFFTAPLPSWHHPHQTDQTPSLSPFRADVVIFQIQVRQGGVLLQGLRQSLAGDTWLERQEWSTHHNDIPQTCKNLTIVLLIYKFRFHEGRLTLTGQLTAWLKKWPDYIQLLQGTFCGNPWTWFLMILNMSGRTNYYNVAQPPTNSWPVHPHLSCLIPLLPYTNFTIWESHPFRHFSLYSIHFTGMTYLDHPWS